MGFDAERLVLQETEHGGLISVHLYNLYGVPVSFFATRPQSWLKSLRSLKKIN